MDYQNGGLKVFQRPCVPHFKDRVSDQDL
jgi:hypothetical protein